VSEQRGGTLSLFRDREFVALAGTAFARSQAYSTILIALALYADAFGTTGFVEGLFGSGFALVQLLIVLPLGRAIDTGNAKRFLLVGLAVNVAVFFGFILVENPVHVILVRMVQGLGASILWITGSTVVGEISADGERGLWLGSYNQVAAFSSLAGDLVGGFLLYQYGFTLTYAVLAVITIAAALLVYGFLRDNPGGQKDPEEATGRETLRSLLGLPTIKALVSFRLGFSVGKMAVIIFLPIYARTEFGLEAFEIGYILAGGKLTKTLFQGYVGDLTDRLGRKDLFVAVGALLYAVGTAMIPFAESAAAAVPTVEVAALGRTLSATGPFLVLFAAYGVLGIADSIRLPASMALFVEEGEQFDSVASAFSLRSIAWKVGQIVGPVAVGVIWDTFGVFPAFWAAAGFIVIATVVFLAVHRRATRLAELAASPADD
jgi:DHA1 family multidrug resistance protein-like MFS transporter